MCFIFVSIFTYLFTLLGIKKYPVKNGPFESMKTSKLPVWWDMYPFPGGYLSRVFLQQKTPFAPENFRYPLLRMRMMRSIKSQLAVETANRTNFEDATWSLKSRIFATRLNQ